MNMRFLLVISGIPASGKTFYGRYISEKLSLPFLCKDAFKEKLHEAIGFETTRENSRLFGNAAYSVFYHAAECLMKSGVSFVIESNFTPSSENIINPLVEKYGYKTVTVMFDADMKILHERFLKRDVTNERHNGLKSQKGFFDDYNTFRDAVLPSRDFSVDKKLVVDTSDFNLVYYDEVDRFVLSSF